MAYKHYTNLDLPQITKEILAYWEEDHTFQKSVAQNEEKPRFNFYEGPPSANGKPGIHHALSRTLKDLFCRYKTMQGHHVPRQAGWDAHGLPIELQAEKELAITKEDIGKTISIADYNKYCQNLVLRFQKEWDQLTKEIGYWADLENPYLTCETSYISTVWGLLQRLHQKKLLYKGYSIQPYSPAAGTGLSTHELNQPNCYKMVKETTIVAQFQLQDEANTYLLAWTTTPWTLPANSALALGPKIIYVKVNTFNRYTQQPITVILAQKALPRYFDIKMQDAPMHPPKKPQDPLPYRLTHTYRGEELCGRTYQQLMPYIQPSTKAFQTVPAHFVTTEDGTGIVHIAPTFGQEDFQLAQQQNIPSITVSREGESLPIVDRQGRFVKEITDFAHQYVKTAYETDPTKKSLSLDIQIAKKLKKENKAFLVASYNHNYPHCWRTDKPILYYPLHAYFIKTTAYKKQLISHNKTIQWQPPTTGIGRFQNWLENLVDWNISRSRFWGTPLPIWRTSDGQEEKCIGSLKELEEEIEKAIQAGIMTESPLPSTPPNLHRPYVDEVILLSPKGEKMYRETDVIDVWFDSGAMPYAHKADIPLDHYKEKSPPPHFPAHFIAEGVDQTRGWFFTLHTLAVMLFDHVAYENVLSTGLVLDKKGNKMSKRLGNTIDPIQLIKEKGPDAIRWYMVSNTSPWENLKFNTENITEIQKKYFGTLHNTYQFFALYANIDQYHPPHCYPTAESCTSTDTWILSRLQHLIETVTQHYNSYNPTPAARAIQHFITEELSNWYVRLNRKRFWASGLNQDKKTAYQTLHICLKTLTQLAAPIAPFYMDHLFQNLHPKKKGSVHLTRFPTLEKRWQNPTLEARMHKAQKIASLTHALRKKHRIKVRQPLQKILLPITDAATKEQIEAVKEIILREVNVKELLYTENTETIVHKIAKPNYQLAGKKYGSKIKNLTESLARMTQEEIQQLEEKGYSTHILAGETLQILREEIVLTTTDLPGWAIASDSNLTVALDLQITPTLQAEGWTRETINKLQKLRKEEGFAVEDKITLHLHTHAIPLKEALERHQKYLMKESQTLILTWEKEATKLTKKIIEIDNYTLHLSILLNKKTL